MARQYIETMHRGGWPGIWNYDSYWRRIREAWRVLTGYQSLHRAWQKGYDCHIQDDSARRANTEGYESWCVANSPKLQNALASIAASTCCDGCQEASKVAKAVLRDCRSVLGERT